MHESKERLAHGRRHCDHNCDQTSSESVSDEEGLERRGQDEDGEHRHGARLFRKIVSPTSELKNVGSPLQS